MLGITKVCHSVQCKWFADGLQMNTLYNAVFLLVS